MDKSYIAGLYDGDGSINMSLVGPEGRKGFLLKVELSQNDLDIINKVNNEFENIGKVYEDEREGRNTNYCLRFCGRNAYNVLNIIATYGIIKAPQACMALEFLDVLKKKDHFNEKYEIMRTITTMNDNKNLYKKPYERINNEYISGIFDAEGNVYFNIINNKKKSYVKITQNGCPEILDKIKEYLGYGSTSELGRYKIYSRKNYISFLNVIKNTNMMKITKLQELISFL